MKFRNTEIIKTARLLLHSIKNKDDEDLKNILTNEEIGRTFMLPDFKSEDEIAAMISWFKSLSESGDRFVYGIYLSDKLIGFVNDVDIGESHVELGYVIHPDFKGQGYATEALRAAIDEIFASGFKKVQTGAFVGNDASIRVMQKCGMVRESFEDEIEYKSEIHKCIYYSIEK